MDSDLIIIGGGVVGCAIARYASRYNMSILLLEAAGDVCTGTSKANSGIIHAGYDPEPGSVKASLNVKGNRMIRELSAELGFPLRNNGAIVLSFPDDPPDAVEMLYRRGKANGVPGMAVLSGGEVLRREKNANPDVRSGLYLSTSSIVCPFLMTIALAENAVANGAVFRFSSPVSAIREESGLFAVHAGSAIYRSRAVVNAAGVYAGIVNSMISSEAINITPRRGQYILMDRPAEPFIGSTLFQIPGTRGKGVLVSPTVHGNLFAGPDAEEVQDREDTSTTSESLDYISELARRSVTGLDLSSAIASFAGLRAHPDGSDFIIGMSSDVPGYFRAAGIESPGLTCAAAIGELLSDEIAAYLKCGKRADFIPERKAHPLLKELSYEERDAMIKQNPLYGRIVCRCEEISEGEIIDAIRGNPGARDLDGVKRRVRAGMGRCQGGFCISRVMEILQRELGIDACDVRKNEPGSEVVYD